MFREMRKKQRQLPQEEAAAILREGSSGVLALAGDEGWPYAVPLSYLYLEGRLYFHCAREGYKLDALRKEPRASFCVIAQDKLCPEKYTTLYRSAIAFGRLRVLEEEGEIHAAIDALTKKYFPEESEASREAAIARSWDAMYLLEMSVEHLTGKARRGAPGVTPYPPLSLIHI